MTGGFLWFHLVTLRKAECPDVIPAGYRPQQLTAVEELPWLSEYLNDLREETGYRMVNSQAFSP